MDTLLITSPRRLSDDELVARVRELAGRERQATACLVAHLAELEARKLHVAEGCFSMFAYCTEILHLSEHAAINRIEAARAARKFPLVLEKLADGSVHLAAVRLLAPSMTAENHRDLLQQATHKTKRQVEEIVARIRPRPANASSVRRLPATRTYAGPVASIDTRREPSRLDPAGTDRIAVGDSLTVPLPDPGFSAPTIEQTDTPTTAGDVVEGTRAGNSRPATPKPHRATVRPVAEDRYNVRFTADAESYKALCQARELLRHQIPDGDAARVIGLALGVLVEKLLQQKLGRRPRRKRDCQPGMHRQVHHRPRSIDAPNVSGGPRRDRPGARPASRHIPTETRRQVWKRDEGQCAFVTRNGHRCTATGWLEFHHVRPFARGGPASVENIELRCRAHNQYEAELCFGNRKAAMTGPRRRKVVPGRVENVIFAPSP